MKPGKKLKASTIKIFISKPSQLIFKLMIFTKILGLKFQALIKVTYICDNQRQTKNVLNCESYNIIQKITKVVCD